ncbi:hypothetical protein [Halobacillus sp. KGW1]|uniref:phage tail protein n=1 Tax=Halobacillus sp. KGW1 TaxID=1793726 RepID=UPI0007817FF2|nr:hypothetical protein [Halobacillus sp. KGW1]
MAKRIKGITIELNGETTGLDKALKGVNSQSAKLNKELKDVERLLKFDPGNTEAVAQKQKLLAKQVQNSTKKLDQLKTAQKQVEAQFKSGKIGEEEYRAFKREVQFAEAEVGKFQKRLKAAGKGGNLSKVSGDIKDIDRDAKKASSSVKGLGKSLGAAATAAGALGGAAIAGLVGNMEDYNRIVARLNTNATNLGFDPAVMEEYAQKVAGVSGEMDSAVETVSNLMATDLTEAQMAQALDEINGAAIRFSDTLKTEGIADGLQETLATGQAIGPFAELLERSGVNLDTFNAGLADAQAKGNAANYALQELSALGLSSVYADYQKLNPELVAQQEAQQNLTAALAEFAIYLTPLVTMVKNFLTSVIEWINGNFELVKSFDTLGQGLGALIEKIAQDAGGILTTIVNGIITNLPLIAQSAFNILQTLATALIENAPLLFETWIQLLQQQSAMTMEFLPTILQLGVQLLTALINGILQHGPALLEAILLQITNIVTIILENLPMIIQAGIQILQAVINGVIQALPQIAEMVLTLINTLVQAIVSNLPSIIQAGMQLLQSLVQGIMSLLPTLASTALNLVVQVLNTIVSNLPMIVQSGVQLLQALIQGILDVLPSLLQTAITLIIELAGALLAQLPEIIAAGVEILLSLIEGLIKTIPDLVAAIPEIVAAIFDAFGDVEWADIGSNIIKGITGGVSSMADDLVDSVKGVVGDAIQGAKNLLGIKSPSRVFRRFGEYTGEGLALGIDSMKDRVNRASNKMVEATIPKKKNKSSSPANPVTGSSGNQSGGNSDLVAIMQEQNQLLMQLLRKDTDVYIGSEKVTAAVNGQNAINDLGKYF